MKKIQHFGEHPHVFGQDEKRPGEVRTLMVIAITGTMMVVEIAAGITFGSMALLADGLHMASHAVALSISAFAYMYARRHAYDPRFSFGTGKVNALGGFTGAVLLALFAFLMAWESGARLIAPVAIAFNQAILVAIVGLIVNGASVFILGRQAHHHDAQHPLEEHSHTHGHEHRDDHNLRAAYLHVLADALTSLLAIFALLTGKYFALIWMDPLMGILGALLVSRWSLELLRTTSSALLDHQGPKPLLERITHRIEQHDDTRVTDLHCWSIGPGIYSAVIAIATHAPQWPDHYKRLLPPEAGLVHVTVEVHRCLEEGDSEETHAPIAGETISS